MSLARPQHNIISLGFGAFAQGHDDTGDGHRDGNVCVKGQTCHNPLAIKLPYEPSSETQCVTVGERRCVRSKGQIVQQDVLCVHIKSFNAAGSEQIVIKGHVFEFVMSDELKLFQITCLAFFKCLGHFYVFQEIKEKGFKCAESVKRLLKKNKRESTPI